MMKTSFLSARYLAIACALSAGATVLPSLAQTPIQAYKDDLQSCEQLQGQAKQACRRDAGAALQAKQQNKISSHEQNLMNNRMARCKTLPAERQQECMLQMQEGQNTVIRGSVKGGGILRETTTTVPATTR